MNRARRLLLWASHLGRAHKRFDLPDAPAAERRVTLDTMRRRLELMLAAIYGRPMRIVPSRPERPPSWYGRIFRPVPAHMRPPSHAARLAGSDGTQIELPPALDDALADASPEAATTHYKLLALQQAERLRRGTSAAMPPDDRPLERDLYLLAESVAVDHALVESTPSLASAIARERNRALLDRPDMSTLTPAEREMETLVRAVLSAPPGQPVAAVPEPPDAVASRAWAASRDRTMHGTRREYRGLPRVRLWGAVRPMDSGLQLRPQLPWELTNLNFTPRRSDDGTDQAGDTPSPHGAPDPADDARSGENANASRDTHADEAQEPPSDDSADAAEPSHRESGSAASAEASTTDAGVEAPGTDASDFDADASGGSRDVKWPPAVDQADEDPGIQYPEWDYLDQQYARLPAVVHLRVPVEATDAWAAAALDAYAPVARRLREKFDKLRARRIRLVRQRDGDELDIPACIEAYVDARTGHAVGDRVYSSVRPARRALAITLLVDISGSTSEKIHDEERVIDVAKLALLVVTQALDALGDPYAIATFSGRGREHVRMRIVKQFDEPSGDRLFRRIGGLAPEGYTRAGAAIRHATTMLMEQPAGHRLLLMLSDGKPNDEDGYAGRYAVEDTRQAILEAQGRGIHAYCLTIDRKGRDYLTRIFGESGHTVLQRPEQLPMALANVIRRLLGARA